jgi:hypothetical protein
MEKIGERIIETGKNKAKLEGMDEIKRPYCRGIPWKKSSSRRQATKLI